MQHKCGRHRIRMHPRKTNRPEPKPLKSSRPPQDQACRRQRRGQTAAKQEQIPNRQAPMPQPRHPSVPRQHGRRKQPEKQSRLFAQKRQAEKQPAQKHRQSPAALARPQQQQQAAQRVDHHQVGGMSLQSKHPGTERKQHIRRAANQHSRLIQQPPGQKIQQRQRPHVDE